VCACDCHGLLQATNLLRPYALELKRIQSWITCVGSQIRRRNKLMTRDSSSSQNELWVLSKRTRTHDEYLHITCKRGATWWKVSDKRQSRDTPGLWYASHAVHLDCDAWSQLGRVTEKNVDSNNNKPHARFGSQAHAWYQLRCREIPRWKAYAYKRIVSYRLFVFCCSFTMSLQMVDNKCNCKRLAYIGWKSFKCSDRC
jgi:hypothetical protein